MSLCQGFVGQVHETTTWTLAKCDYVPSSFRPQVLRKQSLLPFLHLLICLNWVGGHTCPHTCTRSSRLQCGPHAASCWGLTPHCRQRSKAQEALPASQIDTHKMMCLRKWGHRCSLARIKHSRTSMIHRRLHITLFIATYCTLHRPLS